MKKRFLSIISIVTLFILSGCDPVSPTNETINNNLKSKTIDLSPIDRPIVSHENQMILNRFFFIDEVYRLKYLAQFADSSAFKKYIYNRDWEDVPVLKTVEIYKRHLGTTPPANSNNEFYWAQYESYNSEIATNLFEKLIPDVDYTLDQNNGRIYFHSRLMDNDVIALYLEDQSGEWIKGNKATFNHETLNTSVFTNLCVLKNDANLTLYSDSTYHLMLRNVYSIPASKIPDFSIKRVNFAGDTLEKTESGQYFAQVLGLMDENENYLYQNEDIFDLDNGYVFMPPFKKNSSNSFVYNDKRALQPFSNVYLGTTEGIRNWGHVIYDHHNIMSWKNRFDLITIHKEKQTTFILDFDVLPESEALKTEGVTLEKDSDYFIDYNMGYVELLSERAQRAIVIHAQYQL